MRSTNIISANKYVAGGKPCFVGTRIPVSLVLRYFSLGWSIKQISRKFPTLSSSKVTRFIDGLSLQFDKRNG